MNAATIGGSWIYRLRAISCGQVALLVIALYIAWAGSYLLTPGHDVRDFIHIGPAFIAQGHGTSRAIHLDPGYTPLANQNAAARGLGYDGQFSYYIALTPGKARYYMDLPSYRYSRILYPMTARALALGRRAAIPWTLLLINLLAVSGGTWGLAIWLRRRGVSPLWALVYGLWPGMVIGVQRDLSEPLGYGLVVAGLLLLDWRGRWRLPAAGAAFGLAGLARQTTLLFPLAYALWIALGFECDGSPPRQRRFADALTLGCLSVGPALAWSIFLYGWLGSWSDGGILTPVPFGGLLHGPYRLSRQGVDLALVVVPTFAALIALAPPMRLTGKWRPQPAEQWLPWLLLLANVLLNIVFFEQFYSSTYTAVSRLAIGVVLSALMCLPYVGELQVGRQRVLATSAALAMAMLPLVAVYGFTNLSA